MVIGFANVRLMMLTPGILAAIADLADSQVDDVVDLAERLLWTPCRTLGMITDPSDSQVDDAVDFPERLLWTPCQNLGERAMPSSSRRRIGVVGNACTRIRLRARMVPLCVVAMVSG